MRQYLATTIACIWVMGDCVGHAIGTIPQTMFAPGMVWIWWVFALAWLGTAIINVLDAFERKLGGR